MRIALVNDLNLALVALRRVVDSMPNAEVAWVAVDGQQAVEKCSGDRPDVVLMDLIMPVLDGVQATRQIMQSCPCAILVTTATVSGNSNLVFDALSAGAVDAVETPVIGRDANLEGADRLIRKIQQVVKIADWQPSYSTSIDQASSNRSIDVARPPLVAVGSSTGGPQALQVVLNGLERRCTVVIVQHLASSFTAGLAAWLSAETPWPCTLAVAQQTPELGHAYLANGEGHLVLDRAGQFAYRRQPADHLHCPSIDVLFGSLGAGNATGGVAVLLTGMGRDGVLGMKLLRKAGWHTIAQDQASSVVWGMPGAAVRDGAASQAVPLDQVGTTINRMLDKMTKEKQR